MVTLVTGATGAQGNGVVHALLRKGLPVRALVRDAEGPTARKLAKAGVEIAVGSFEQPLSLRRAMEGAASLFSVQPAPGGDRDAERNQARALMQAARDARIRHVIHSSVSNTGAFRHMAGWSEGRWDRNYWESKADAEQIMRAADFPVLTILRPAFMMENFAQPKAQWMFPDLTNGAILTAIQAETSLVLVAAEDIGQAAAAAVEQPDRFAGLELELAGDLMTLPRIAATLSAIRGVPITTRTLDIDSLIARGQHRGWVQTQQWMNVVNYPARPEMMERWGLEPTSFAHWARRHADIIPAG